MRYLVVLPPGREADAARFHELERDHVAIGDDIFVDDLLVRVHNVVAAPADDHYDATLICTVQLAREYEPQQGVM